MTDFQSLRSRAHQLEKFAKAESAREGEVQGLERTKTALDRLSEALLEFVESLKTRRALDGLGVERGVSPDIGAPYRDLQDYVDNRGLPNQQKLSATTKRVREQATTLDIDNAARWASWATQQLRGVDRHKTTVLSGAARSNAEAWIRDLESATRNRPSVDAISAFSTKVGWVHDALAKVTADGDLLTVLARFAETGVVSLANLTDEEISLLRADDSVATQFVVRRQT